MDPWKLDSLSIKISSVIKVVFTDMSQVVKLVDTPLKSLVGDLKEAHPIGSVLIPGVAHGEKLDISELPSTNVELIQLSMLAHQTLTAWKVSNLLNEFNFNLNYIKNKLIQSLIILFS